MIIRCLPWRILVLFRKLGISERTVGFFLQCNAESESLNWSCRARAELTIASQKDASFSASKNIEHNFHAKENDWGFSHFINWSELTDPTRGYIGPRGEESPQKVWLSDFFQILRTLWGMFI